MSRSDAIKQSMSTAGVRVRQKAQRLQVVDLEVAADHRGSILGDHPTRLQPPQKMFESKLLHQMRNFSVDRPVFIESESSLVGRRQVPNSMWKVCISTPLHSCSIK